MRTRLPALLAAGAVLAGTLAAVALAADPPVVETKPATAVGQTQATLVASVDPKGTATTVHFELGTSTAYGLRSADKAAGSGTGAVTVEIPVQGLTAGTTYHVQAVATSAGGTAQGADVTFKTATAPAAPSVSTGAARAVAPTSATLTGSVNPRGQATSYEFQYGTSTSYGATTPRVDMPAGTKSVAVSAPVTGLTAGKRYHYRLVATNPTGTTRGGDRSFTTATTPAAATLVPKAQPVTYGSAAVLTGRLTGSKVSGVRVRLQLTPFPFSAPFADAGNAQITGRSGTYTFTIGALGVTTRAVVIADGLPSILSPIVELRCAVRAGITTVRRGGRRVVIAGRVRPATPAGVAALQRRTADGRWVPLRRVRISAADGRYRVVLRARRRPMTVRVVGLPHDGGAHVPAASRMVRLAGSGS